jgi:hypothetical protein
VLGPFDINTGDIIVGCEDGKPCGLAEGPVEGRILGVLDGSAIVLFVANVLMMVETILYS